MALIDYLVVARGGQVLHRIGWFGAAFEPDRLDRCRRLGRREPMAPDEVRQCMKTASSFWYAVGAALALVMVVWLVGVGLVWSKGGAPGGWFVPSNVALAGLTFAMTMFGFALVRSRNIDDGVIAQRAGRRGNRVLASAALPKPRDFWVGIVVGLLTLAIALSS
jgi:hypothetical protein